MSAMIRQTVSHRPGGPAAVGRDSAATLSLLINNSKSYQPIVVFPSLYDSSYISPCVWRVWCESKHKYGNDRNDKMASRPPAAGFAGRMSLLTLHICNWKSCRSIFLFLSLYDCSCSSPFVLITLSKSIDSCNKERDGKTVRHLPGAGIATTLSLIWLYTSITEKVLDRIYFFHHSIA